MERIKVSQLRPATTENYGMRNVSNYQISTNNQTTSSQYYVRAPQQFRPQVSSACLLAI